MKVYTVGVFAGLSGTVLSLYSSAGSNITSLLIVYDNLPLASILSDEIAIALWFQKSTHFSILASFVSNFAASSSTSFKYDLDVRRKHSNGNDDCRHTTIL